LKREKVLGKQQEINNLIVASFCPEWTPRWSTNLEQGVNYYY